MEMLAAYLSFSVYVVNICLYVYVHLCKCHSQLSDQSFQGHQQQMMCACVCREAQLRAVFNVYLLILIPALAGQAAACCGKCSADLDLVVPGIFAGGSVRMWLALGNGLFTIAQEDEVAGNKHATFIALQLESASNYLLTVLDRWPSYPALEAIAQNLCVLKATILEPCVMEKRRMVHRQAMASLSQRSHCKSSGPLTKPTWAPSALHRWGCGVALQPPWVLPAWRSPAVAK